MPDSPIANIVGRSQNSKAVGTGIYVWTARLDYGAENSQSCDRSGQLRNNLLATYLYIQLFLLLVKDLSMLLVCTYISPSELFSGELCIYKSLSESFNHRYNINNGTNFSPSLT